MVKHFGYLKTDLRIEVLNRNFMRSVYFNAVPRSSNLGRELTLSIKLCQHMPATIKRLKQKVRL
jgi:hypothetical protein